MYHVGRPGDDGYMERVLQSWGVDGHNSHTNVCSAGARLGYARWMGADRPSPDHANAKFILLLSSHLETGHYFNPHAQRIIDGKMAGAKLAVVDVRLSNTASMADYWLPTWPGTEAAVLLAMANVILDEGGYDREFVRRWVNWESYLRAERPDLDVSVDSFVDSPARALRRLHARAWPKRRAASRPSRSSRSPARSPTPARASRPTSGATPRPATSAAGRSRAASSCSTC